MAPLPPITIQIGVTNSEKVKIILHSRRDLGIVTKTTTRII
jgi:hypothetical protein